MTESETKRPMRERAADAAAKYLGRCAFLGTSIDYADLVDVVLAEIERPSEGMIDAGVLMFFDPDVRAAVAKILGAAIRAATP